MNESIKILIVDDDAANADYVARILDNFELDVVLEPIKALELFSEKKYDLVISDQKMPVLSGLNLLKRCNEVTGDFQGIIISAYTDAEDLIDAVNSNIIYKYIIKPFFPETLLQHVHRAYEALKLKREKEKLEQMLHKENMRLRKENSRLKSSEKEYGTERLAGSSREMTGLKEQIRTYAASDSSVLITGETGTGKELVGEAVHELSEREEQPFLKINCTTLSASLIESELFGHEKGAFTGADKYKKGFFETADGGTIFLDEIGDIPVELQPKLLRILQFGTFYPVGGRAEKKVNVRIIAASNRDLEDAVSDGSFREDLYHRLNRLRLKVPPLRERRQDIPVIFRVLYKKECEKSPELTPEALQVLSSYSYPGNVRELETYIHRLLLVNPYNEVINEEMLMRVMDTGAGTVSVQTGTVDSDILKHDVENLERDRIRRSLEKYNYNITKTADSLGLSRPGLHNKMKRYGLSKN